MCAPSVGGEGPILKVGSEPLIKMSSSDEEQMSPVKDMNEAAVRLRSSRAEKMSHISRRMNSVNKRCTVMIEMEGEEKIMMELLKHVKEECREVADLRCQNNMN